MKKAFGPAAVRKSENALQEHRYKTKCLSYVYAISI